jgi:hypothetical protein
MRTWETVAILSAATVLAACSPSTDAPATETSSSSVAAGPIRGPGPSVATPIVASVVAAPIPVPTTDGKTHLAYELELTNVLAHDLTLTSLTVLDRDVSLLDLHGDELGGWTRIVGNPAPTTTIGPAQTAIVWLDVVLEKDAAVPTRLTHNISFSNPQPLLPLFPATMTENVAPVEVQTREPVVISPPLTGPNWLAGNGCCGMEAHRMSLNPINGQLWAAERFAIDYVQIEADRRQFHGDPKKLESYPAFGHDILAVADGPVVAAVDGLPEQVPGTDPTGLPLDQYAGNHIVQDLGNGNYALYAHIKTGTVGVKPGDRLTTGQVIGFVGNTGNTTAPHLHFHVMSTADPLRSNGLPFVYNQFRLDSRVSGTTAELEALPPDQPIPLQQGFAARDENDVMPMDLDVMTYADR